MNELFISGFGSMAGALSRIFIVMAAAGILVRKKIITGSMIEGLSKVTVFVFLPCLAFSKTLSSFDPVAMPFWWLLPILGIGLSLLGLLLAFPVFLPNFRKHMNLSAVASMQNAGYLVLPVGKVIYPEQFDEFAAITFLFILGYNPLLWTLGKYLVTSGSADNKITLRSFITPPAVANILSLIIVLIGADAFVHPIISDSSEMLGEAAVPTATFVLGATLGKVTFKEFPKLWDNIRVLLVKYALLPAVVIGILLYLEIEKQYPLAADFFVIQASAAPAVALILQVRTYGGDTQKVAGSMIISYLASLLAMPFWISLWYYIR